MWKKMQGIDFVRIGRHESVHEEIKGHCFSGQNVYYYQCCSRHAT